jgi:PAS domain S-box-containing protein
VLRHRRRLAGVDVRQFLERAFPDHSIGEKLREDAEGTLFRGRRIGDGQAVLFVTSVAEHPTSEWLVRLEREYVLREDLELPWAARLLALVRLEGRMVLLLEDPGGRPLDVFPARRFSVGESLRLALGIAASLSRVHAKGLLHQGIKPANILADPAAGTAALMGFGIAAATAAAPEGEEPVLPDALVGTLGYLAPEQTGRMKRPLDARSDLYSLGVVLYEALTGRLPFTADEPSKLLRSHVALQAVPPLEVDPAIPVLVSDLVMKLLAKAPEERYQTALGLEADLRRALDAWEAHGRIEPFPLAQADVPEPLHPPEPLQGPELEVETRAVPSADDLLLSEPPGAGESSLVNALCRISGEIEPGKLAETLMGIVMDHSGADRGLLLLSSGDTFRVEVEAGLDLHGLAIWQPRTTLAPGQLADGVFRHVLTTRQPVILEDASGRGPFSEDPYVKGKKSKSIFALPLIKQSRLLGVLYFENSRAAGVFSPKRVAALEVLAAQAAISLENARLFADLEQEKRRLQAVIQQVPAGLIIAEAPSGRFLIQNDRVERMLHGAYYRPSSSVNEYDQYRGFRPDGRAYAAEEWPLARSIRTGETVTEEEVELRWPDGSRAWLSLSSTPIRNPAGIITSGILIFQDITERKRREDALRASEERFSKAFKSNPTPMAVLRSKDSTFVDVNEQFLRLLGYAPEEIHGRCARELGSWFIKLLDEAGKRLAAGAMFRDQEYSATARSGESKALLVSIETVMLGEDTCYLAIFVDLTERKQVEEQLRQSQKMEAIGSLAGGVAHDFNNLLTAINGYSELAMMGMEVDSPEYEHLKAVRSSGERAAGLTRQLLAFSRKETVQNQVQSLNAIVAEMEGMLRRLIEENVEIKTYLDPEVGSVNVDKGQVVQVLMNLVVNARDAMPEGGRLHVETRRVRLDKSAGYTLLEAAPGTYATLTVKDTGTGMTPEVKAKIFEPFFTTKAAGKGTGLGLSVVYGVVKQLGGGIALHSEPGQGTTFCIYLPEVQAGTLVPTSDAAGRVKPESHRGSEIILVVEDEDSVRKFIKRALAAQGYRVLEARNGVEALRVLEASEQPLDLVMTDLIMPDMGGRELAAQVRAHRPTLPVLYTSGYSNDKGEAQEVPAIAEYFLPKPFGPLELARKVREVLKHSREAAPASAAVKDGAL